MFSATELNDYLEQIAKEMEDEADVPGWSPDYSSGLGRAAEIVRDRMIDMGEVEKSG